MRTRSFVVFAGICALAGSLGCNGLTGADDLQLDKPKSGSGSGGSSASASASDSSSTGSSSTTTSSASTTTSGSSSSSSSVSSSSSASSSGTGGTDPYAQYRQECVDHINQLRATKGLPPYQRWTAAESCVDQLVTYDEQHGQAHDAFINHAIACDGYGSGQNECLGGCPQGIVSCLDAMWAEKDQAGCSGCDACDLNSILNNTCPNCSFYGPPECGHYINMSAKWFSEVACGFSSAGGWGAQDFQ